METIREQILKHLSSLSRKKRPTNIKMAEAAGMSTRCLESWRAGKHGMKEANLDKLLNFLRLEIKGKKNEQVKRKRKDQDT